MEQNLEQLDPRPLVLKKMMWDILPHDEDMVAVQLALGVTPDSEDGADVDHKASDRRLLTVAPLLKVLSVMSTYAAEVITWSMMQEIMESAAEDAEDEDDIPDFDEDYVSAFQEQNLEAILLSAVAIIGQLFDNEVLTWGKRVSNEQGS